LVIGSMNFFVRCPTKKSLAMQLHELLLPTPGISWRVTEIAKQAWRFYREPSPPVLTEFAPVLGLFFAAFWHAPG
jgi:hypothetical protein